MEGSVEDRRSNRARSEADESRPPAGGLSAHRQIEKAAAQALSAADLAPAAETARPAMSGTSLALHNLRGVVILIVVAFHSALAYLGSSPPSPFPFDEPPYQWRAFAIIDPHRFFGFDLFCAWQDVYLMALMFFLSALFTWPSLARKGVARFLSDRLLRLGAPFLFGVAVVMPIALYPVYRVTAYDPDLSDYARHFLALPFWPNGPMWFLWQLLALTIAAAALRRFWPGSVGRLARTFSQARSRPGRCFVWLAAASALAYVPLAIAFTPWRWADHGPLALQFSRPLLYALYYFVGLVVGAAGLERSLLATDGALARSWRFWLAFAATFLLAWMGLTGLTLKDGASSPLLIQLAAEIAFAATCAASLFFAMAVSLRFGTVRSPLLDSLAKNAMGVYVLHYAPVVWLQYALLGAALPAVAKATIVFSVALLASWAATAILRSVPYGCRLIGEERRLARRVVA